MQSLQDIIGTGINPQPLLKNKVVLQEAPPTLATLIGALSIEGKSSVQTAARTALHPDERSKLRLSPALQSQAKPSWLPRSNAAETLPREALLEVAVPLDPRQVLS